MDVNYYFLLKFILEMFDAAFILNKKMISNMFKYFKSLKV